MKLQFAQHIVWISCLIGVGCGESRRVEQRSLLEPVALDSALVWLDRANDEALVLDVGSAEPEPEIRALSLPARPRMAFRRNGHDELLALLRGEEDEDDGKLAVIGVGKVDRVYEIGTSFDTLTQSNDGRYAILHFLPGGRGSDDASFLFNPNEIAIVDLDREGKDAVVQRTLRSLGSTPRRIEFSPPMEIAGETRRLAVVFFQSEVSLLDLNHLDRPEYTIELSRGANLTLNQVRFSADDQKIYLLATGSSDVFVLRLLPSGAGRSNDFEPSLNQLGTDAAPRDMVVFDAGGERRLLVASGNSAQVVEASSNRVTQIPLVNQAQSILPFQGRSPFDSRVEPRALLYALGSGGLTFLDLEEIEVRTTRNREELNVASIRALVPLDDGRALLNHDGGSLSILDLNERTVAPIQTRFGFEAAVPDFVSGRIWVAPQASTSLGFIDLGNLHPGQVRLDRPIERFFLFNQARQPRVVTTHYDPSGAVTLLSSTQPTDASRAVTLEGFFFTGVLDR